MIYYVIEIQSGDTGAVLPFSYTNLADAEAKYHEILAFAAKSNVRKHGAILFNENGFVSKQEVYEHPNVVEEPEVTEEL